MKKFQLSVFGLLGAILLTTGLYSCSNEDSISENLTNEQADSITQQNLSNKISQGEDLFNSIFLLEGSYVENIEFLQDNKAIYSTLPNDAKNQLNDVLVNDRVLISQYIQDNNPEFYSEFEEEMFSKDTYRMREAYKTASKTVFNALKSNMRELATQLMDRQVPLDLFEETNFNSIEDIEALRIKLETDYNVVTGKSRNVIRTLDGNIAINKNYLYNSNIQVNEVININKGANFTRVRNIIWVTDLDIENKLILDIYNAI